AFGSLVAAGAPVVSGVLVIVLALGASGMLAARWPLSILLQTFVSMIGLGLGIDYALLSVSRFREALAAGGDPVQAAVATGRSAGRTILLSGLTVALGFAALLAVPLGELRSVAVGGLRDLEKMGRGAVPQTVRVILELPSGQDVLSRAGWQAAGRLRGRLAQDPRVSATLSFATFQSDRPMSRLAVFTLASDVRR